MIKLNNKWMTTNQTFWYFCCAFYIHQLWSCIIEVRLNFHQLLRSFDRYICWVLSLYRFVHSYHLRLNFWIFLVFYSRISTLWLPVRIEMDRNQLIDSLVFEYLRRTETNSSVLFDMNRRPVRHWLWSFYHD